MYTCNERTGTCIHVYIVSHLVLADFHVFLHAGLVTLHQVLVLIQHVVNLSAVELVMKAVEGPDLHDVIVVGIVTVKDDSVLCVCVYVCVCVCACCVCVHLYMYE